MISLYKKQGIKNMLSDELNKISNVILASKLTNKAIGSQIEQSIGKIYFQNRGWDLLNQQERQDFNKIKDQVIKKIDIFLEKVSEILKIQLTKDLIVMTNNLIKSVDGNICLDQNKDQFINTIKDYVTYKQFLNPQLQDITKVDSLNKIYDAINTYKKVLAVKQQEIKDYKVAIRRGNYVVLQITDEDKQRFIKWFKGKANWCILGGMWNRHERPYFLVLQNYKPVWLVNIPTRQWRNLQNGAIKTSELNKDLISIAIEIFEKYYNKDYWYGRHYFGTDNIDVFVPYFPEEQIAKGIEIGRIKDDLLKSIVKNAFKSNNDKLIQSLINVLVNNGKTLNDLVSVVSNENQYKKIMLKMFPKPKQEKEEAWLKSNVTLHINDLKQILFNAFETGNNLFKRMLKFFPTQQNINIYKQGQQYNTDLLNIRFNNKGFIDVISNLKQLKLLNQVTQQATNNSILLSKEQGMQLFRNFCSKEIKDMPTIQFLLNKKIIQINSQTLRMAIDTGADSVNKQFINAADANVLNSPIYNDVLPLFYCIKQKKYNVLDLFLQSDKVQSDISTSDGKDIIWYALQLADKEVIISLIDRVKNLDFNKVYPVGILSNNTLLSYFVKNNQDDMADLLLKNNNIDVNIKSPIDNAIANNDTNMVNKIISHIKFNPYSKNDNGDAPVMVAIMTDRTFSMFELLADKMGKANLSKSDLINPKTKMTPLMLAVDNDMPYEIIIKYFDNKSISYSNKSSKNVYDIVTTKLSIKPNDENMLKIKKWVQQQNKTKTKKKQIDLQTQLMTFVNRGNEDAFKQLLEENPQGFDFSKKINGYNIVNLLAIKPTASKYLKLLLQFIDNSNKYKSQLKGLLQQFDYSDASQSSKAILKPYYEQAQIKISSTNFKKILAFVERFLS